MLGASVSFHRVGYEYRLVNRGSTLDPARPGPEWEAVPPDETSFLLSSCWHGIASKAEFLFSYLIRELATPSGRFRIWRRRAAAPAIHRPAASPTPAPPAPVLPRFTRTPKEERLQRIELERHYHDDEPVHGAHFIVRLSDGSEREGTLDDNGQAVIEDVPDGVTGRVQFGPDARPWELADKRKNPAFTEQLTQADIDVLISRAMGGA
jgi:hypothetical protein